MSRSDVVVIGSLIKSNRDPVKKGSTAHSHCSGLDKVIFVLSLPIAFEGFKAWCKHVKGLLVEISQRKMCLRHRAKPSQDNLFFS